MTEKVQKTELREGLYDTNADDSTNASTVNETGTDVSSDDIAMVRPDFRWVHWLTILSIQMLGPFSKDTYIPNIPSMVKELETTDFAAGLTLQVNWITAGVLAIGIGTISDRLGRRPVFFCSYAFYLAGTLGSFLAPSIELLILARMVQGMGEASSSMAAAIVRDLIEDVNQRAHMNYILGMIRPLGIMSAPPIGGLIGASLGWRTVFLLLTAWGLLNVSLIYHFLPETAPLIASSTNEGIRSSMRRALVRILRHRISFGLLITMAVWYACPAVMLSNIAPVFEDQFKFPVVATSLLIGLLPSASILTSTIMSVLSKRVSTFTSLRSGMALALVLACLMIVLAVANIKFNAYIIMPVCYAMVMSMPLVMGSSMAIFMQPFADIAGLASGIQSGLGSITSSAVAAVATALTERFGPHAMLASLGANMCMAEAVFWIMLGCKRHQDVCPHGEPNGKGKGGGKGGGKGSGK